MSPVRVQRKRTKGYRLPEGAVYVGRPTEWGNPYEVGEWVNRDDPELWPHVARMIPGGPVGAFGIPFSRVKLSRDMAVQAFFDFIIERPHMTLAAVDALRGKDLACWCPLDQPCHADVLLELANA